MAQFRVKFRVKFRVPGSGFQVQGPRFRVPGLGFTKSGSRLGRGSGHYDKLLYKNPSVLKIGVCHDFQIVDYIPEEDHDISMDYVFTDKNYYKSAI